MKYKPWGWVDVFEDGRIKVGTEWTPRPGREPILSAKVTGGEELVTEEIKTVMAALDFVEEGVVLPCGSHHIDGFSFDRSAIGTIPVRTYFIFLGEHDESE